MATVASYCMTNNFTRFISVLDTYDVSRNSLAVPLHTSRLSSHRPNNKKIVAGSAGGVKTVVSYHILVYIYDGYSDEFLLVYLCNK